MYSNNRIWDAENKRKQKTVIVVKSKERGARTKVTTCAFSHDGKLIAGGKHIARPRKIYHHLSNIPCLLTACLDGTLNIWGSNSNFVRPSHTAENAHEKGKEVGSVAFSVDGHTVVSRGMDEYTKRTYAIAILLHQAKIDHSVHPCLTQFGMCDRSGSQSLPLRRS